MNVLVVNAGSSSLKYQLLDTDTREVFAKGNCERIGSEMGIFGHSENGGAKQTEEIPFPDHRCAIARVLEELEKTDFTIDGIGHRIVQGGWHFDDSAVVDDEVMAKILEVAPLAPLHNYGEAAAIEYCREKYPELPNVAVFDTSFHMTMPEVAYTYALPKDVCDKLHIRKYGAHGTSYRYISKKVAEMTNGEARKVVVCHIGSGASLCAIEDVLPDLDMVLLMTVNPGFAGQKLVPATLPKIARLRAMLDSAGYPQVRIEVDGNVSFENAVRMRRAGADLFVAGTSSVFREGGINTNMEKLLSCIQ